MINITMIICLSAIAIALVIANAKEKIELKKINTFEKLMEEKKKQEKELIEMLDKELSNALLKKGKEKENEHNK